jgi:hypothetical protein
LRKVDRRAETGRKKSGDRREEERDGREEEWRQEKRRVETGGNGRDIYVERSVGTGRKESWRGCGKNSGEKHGQQKWRVETGGKENEPCERIRGDRKEKGGERRKGGRGQEYQEIK